MAFLRQKLIVVWLGLLACTSASAASSLRNLLAEDRLEEALPICRQYEVLAADDAENQLACTWVYLRLGKVDSAEASLSKLRRKSSLPEYQLLVAFSQLKKKDYDGARNVVETIMREHKGTGIGLMAEELSAEIYEVKGQLDTAAFIYRQIVGVNANRARAHWGLGRFYLARGDTAKAKVHLQQTAKFWPKHVASRFNLGVLALTQDNLREADEWLVAAYRLNKADAGVLEQLGLLFEKRKLIGDAVKFWERAMDLNPQSQIAREKLALYQLTIIDNLVASQQYALALTKLERYGKNLNSEPKLLLRRALIQKNLGLAKNDRGKIEKAAADLIVYLNQNPTDVAAERELGICYVNLGQWSSAVSQFEKVVKDEPGNGMNFAWYGFVLEAKGDLEKARDMYKKAVSFLNDPAEVQKANRKLATIEKKLGK